MLKRLLVLWVILFCDYLNVGIVDFCKYVSGDICGVGQYYCCSQLSGNKSYNFFYREPVSFSCKDIDLAFQRDSVLFKNSCQRRVLLWPFTRMPRDTPDIKVDIELHWIPLRQLFLDRLSLIYNCDEIMSFFYTDNDGKLQQDKAKVLLKDIDFSRLHILCRWVNNGDVIGNGDENDYEVITFRPSLRIYCSVPKFPERLLAVSGVKHFVGCVIQEQCKAVLKTLMVCVEVFGVIGFECFDDTVLGKFVETMCPRYKQDFLYKPLGSLVERP